MGANVSTSAPAEHQLIPTCNHGVACYPVTASPYGYPPWCWSWPTIPRRCPGCGCWWHGRTVCSCGCGVEGPTGPGLRVRGTVGDDDIDIRVGGKDSDCGCCAKDRCSRNRENRRTRSTRTRRRFDDNDEQPLPAQPPDYFASRFRHMPTRDRVGILEDNVEVLRGDIHGLERKFGAVAPQTVPQFERRFGGLQGPFGPPLGPDRRYANPGLDGELDLFEDDEDMLDLSERMPSRRPRWAARHGPTSAGRRQVPSGYQRGSGALRRPFGAVPGMRLRPGMRANPARQRGPLFQDLLDDDEEDEGGLANADNSPADNDNDPDWEDVSESPARAEMNRRHSQRHRPRFPSSRPQQRPSTTMPTSMPPGAGIPAPGAHRQSSRAGTMGQMPQRSSGERPSQSRPHSSQAYPGATQ